MDVEAMLDEALERRMSEQNNHQGVAAENGSARHDGDEGHNGNGHVSRGDDGKDEEKERSSRRHHRSRSDSKSRSRSRSRSRSPSRRHRSSRRSRSPSRRHRKHRSRSPSHRHRSRSRSRSRSPPRRRSPRRSSPPPPKKNDGPLSDVERDARTVVCMQLAPPCKSIDLVKFFEENGCGRVRSAKVITDKISRRSKGIAYVEFFELLSVPKALTLNGRPLMHVPISVNLTQSEKNRLAAAKAEEEKASLSRLTVANLPLELRDDHLRELFASFGRIKECLINRDASGISTGVGYVEFDDPKPASLALEALNNTDLFGNRLLVSIATQRFGALQTLMASGGVLSTSTALDNEKIDKGGVPMTAAARASLMANLAASHGTSVPAAVVQLATGSLLSVATPQVQTSLMAPPTECLLIKNMFDPAKETDEDWHLDVQAEFIEEGSKFGPLVHVFVDKTSPYGHVYAKYRDVASAIIAQKQFHGRCFGGLRLDVEHIPLNVYHDRFPEAATAVKALTVD